YACGISVQSAEKSDYASYAQALFSVSFMQCFRNRTKAIPHNLCAVLPKKNHDCRRTSSNNVC
ncbi:MAG: hypothetical protein ACLTYC_05105, partial [Ruminococcus callidus]|uniref:hypothetical protein n=1 Tax=Ruminococcus callidus TaxID=40519 RepID=UPI003994F2C1